MSNSVTKSGTYNVICDRCGFKFKNYQLRKEWTGAMVCFGPGTADCWEPRHPQEFIRVKPDNPKLPFLRADTDGPDVSPTLDCDGLTAEYISPIALNIMLTDDLTVYKMVVTPGAPVVVPSGTVLTVLCELEIQ